MTQKQEAVSADVNAASDRARRATRRNRRPTDGGQMGRRAERQSQAGRQADRQMVSSQADRRVDRVRNGTRPVGRCWKPEDGVDVQRLVSSASIDPPAGFLRRALKPFAGEADDQTGRLWEASGAA